MSKKLRESVQIVFAIITCHSAFTYFLIKSPYARTTLLVITGGLCAQQFSFARVVHRCARLLCGFFSLRAAPTFERLWPVHFLRNVNVTTPLTRVSALSKPNAYRGILFKTSKNRRYREPGIR